MEFPTVPEEQKPKTLFHEGMPDAVRYEAEMAGWFPQDVRLMPTKTDADRVAIVKAVLEGVRIGTIEADPKRLRFLELECKVLGMIGGKAMSSEPPNDDDVNELLGQGKGHP